MTGSQIATVNFHGSPLTVITGNEGQHLVAMKPICNAIGLDWKSQYNRIQRHPVLSTCMVIMTTQMPGDDQQREVTCLPVDYLNGWLFGVDANRVKPEIRDTLLQYQRECFGVLAAHWQGAAGDKRQPVQPQLLGEPLLNLAVQREIRRVARTLCGRHYNHYLARLTNEALKEFPEDPMEVALLAERIWINEQSRDEIDRVPVQWLQESYDCCIDYLTANKPGLHPAQKRRFLQHWSDRMSKLAQHFE